MKSRRRGQTLPFKPLLFNASQKLVSVLTIVAQANPRNSQKPVLTTEPHDKHHLGRDLVVSEEVEHEGERKDVHCPAQQHQDLHRVKDSVRHTGRDINTNTACMNTTLNVVVFVMTVPKSNPAVLICV